MARRQIFYSFHFDYDVMRVQQIRNIGVIEGNEPVSKNDWEQIRKNDDDVKKWIDDNMKYKSCVVVLVGEETAKRPWVKYEIKKAWKDGKGLLGIHINNVKCPRNGTCNKGVNPFEQFTFDDGIKLSSKVRCYDPNSYNAYNDIADNIADWIDAAVTARSR